MKDFSDLKVTLYISRSIILTNKQYFKYSSTIFKINDVSNKKFQLRCNNIFKSIFENNSEQ